MISKKGLLKFLWDEGWVIFTSTDEYLRVYKDTIANFGLKRNDHYYRCFYRFNMYGDLCIWLDEHSFSLDKSIDYEVVYQPMVDY